MKRNARQLAGLRSGPSHALCAIRQPGLALVLVLGMVAILAILMTLILRDSVLLMRDQAWHFAQGRSAPQTPEYVDIALATINEITILDGGLHSPVQGWDDIRAWVQPDVLIPDHISITLTDETSRIGIQDPNQDTLITLLESLGLDFDTRQQLADCLLDWIDADDDTRLHGAEESEYQRIRPEGPYPANRPLASFDELRHVSGFTPLFFAEDGQLTDLGMRLREAVSIYHQQPVNLNTASRTVIESLFPERTFEIDTFLRDRDGDDRRSFSSAGAYWKAHDAIATYMPDLNRRAHGTTARMVRITITDSSGDFPVVREFLAEPAAGSDAQWIVTPL